MAGRAATIVSSKVLMQGKLIAVAYSAYIFKPVLTGRIKAFNLKNFENSHNQNISWIISVKIVFHVRL